MRVALPHDVIRADHPELVFQLLQPLRRIVIDETRQWLRAAQTFQFRPDGPAVSFPGDDRDVVEFRHLQCPLPADSGSEPRCGSQAYTDNKIFNRRLMPGGILRHPAGAGKIECAAVPWRQAFLPASERPPANRRAGGFRPRDPLAWKRCAVPSLSAVRAKFALLKPAGLQIFAQATLVMTGLRTP